MLTPVFCASKIYVPCGNVHNTIFVITVYSVTLLMESIVFDSTYNNNFIRMYIKKNIVIEFHCEYFNLSEFFSIIF